MKRLLIALSLLALAGGALAQESVTFEMLDVPVQGTWIAASTSFDGSRIAGNFGGDIWLYENGAWVHLGAGHQFSSSVGIAADGASVISTAADDEGITHPAVWREADGWATTLLPAIPGYEPCDNSYGSGYALSQDGAIAVGLGWNVCSGVAYMWTAADGARDIGPVRASNISADGSVIVGFDHHPTYGYRVPAYWRHDHGTVTGPILIADEDGLGEVYDALPDGSMICGEYNDGTMWDTQAFVYTEADGIRLLGTVEPLDTHGSKAIAMAVDGKIVGVSGEGGPWGFQQGFLYREGEGMQYLWDYLLNNGADIPAGIYPIYILDLAGDGSLIVGAWLDDNFQQGMFLVRFHGGVATEDQGPVVTDTLPAAFTLAQNYPNPFNPQTTIAFALPQAQHVRLDIFDSAGRLVRTLVDEDRAAGEHQALWNGTDGAGRVVPSGTYLYRIQSESNVQSRTMTLLK